MPHRLLLASAAVFVRPHGLIGSRQSVPLSPEARFPSRDEFRHGEAALASSRVRFVSWAVHGLVLLAHPGANGRARLSNFAGRELLQEG